VNQQLRQSSQLKEESLPESANVIPDRGHVAGSYASTEFDLDYYGWRVVLAACLGVMAGFGSLFVYTFSVFVKPLATEFGWTREAISSGFAIAAVTLGFVSPLLGRWIDRFGPRRIILACMTIYACALASLAFLRSGIWQFYVTCLVLGLVGNGAAHLAYSRSISTWFERRLGLALAFVMVGAGLGAMTLPVVAQSIISRWGWRAAYGSLAGLALLLGLPLSWRYIRERGTTAPTSAPVVRSGVTWQKGLRSFAFWIVTAILFVSSISMNGAITHLSALLTDRGITSTDAALCASVLGGSSPAWANRGGMAARPFFRTACRAWNQPAHSVGNLSAGSGRQFRCGMPCGCAHRRRGGRRSRYHALSSHALFWTPCFFHSLRSHLDVLCCCRSDWTGDPRAGI